MGCHVQVLLIKFEKDKSIVVILIRKKNIAIKKGVESLQRD